MSIKESKDGTLITIFVKPNSPKFSIELDEEIVVHATEEPEKGKVNKEILKEFSKLFQVRSAVPVDCSDLGDRTNPGKSVRSEHDDWTRSRGQAAIEVARDRAPRVHLNDLLL